MCDVHALHFRWVRDYHDEEIIMVLLCSPLFIMNQSSINFSHIVELSHTLRNESYSSLCHFGSPSIVDDCILCLSLL